MAVVHSAAGGMKGVLGEYFGHSLGGAAREKGLSRADPWRQWVALEGANLAVQ